jgi:cysteine desulfurase
MSAKIYLDNAATTCLHPQVKEVMFEVMDKCYGNPSSIHSFGREARTIIEKSRKRIAELMGVAPSEIFFTSGGTESNNMVLRKSVSDLGIKTIISSSIEHHAVTHTLEELEKNGLIKLINVALTENGNVDLEDLKRHLQENSNCLVSLMHANNEIGNVLPLNEVAQICIEHDALFHSDTVQTVGHFPLNFFESKIHFANSSAHKFHGPKGIGFCYISSNVKLKPYITGGAQERNMRAGTENIYAIAGMTKALELAIEDMEQDAQHIRQLKSYFIKQLKTHIPGVEFNGDISDRSLYTVLNVYFPHTPDADMLLFKLDISGVAVSGGSACSSGTDIGSHVIYSLRGRTERPSVRFSFCKYNTMEEIDQVMGILVKEFEKVVQH